MHKNPEIGKTEAMIYDYGELSYNDKKLYYYVIEKMTTFDTSPELSINSFNSFVDDIIYRISKFARTNKEIHNIDLEKEHKELNQYINEFISTVDDQDNKYMEQYTKELNLNKKWFERFVEEVLIKIITKREDLHLGNLGITNAGYLRYFDSII